MTIFARAVAAMFLCLLTTCSGASDTSQEGPLQGLAQGSLAKLEILETPQALPEVEFLYGLDAKPLAVADMAGAPMLINIWATWCRPCVNELPSLDRLQAQQGGEAFKVVAVSIDRAPPQTVQDFLAKNEIKTLDLYRDTKAQLPLALELNAMPTTLAINSKGEIVAQLLGEAEWDSPEALAFVAALKQL